MATAIEEALKILTDKGDAVTLQDAEDIKNLVSLAGTPEDVERGAGILEALSLIENDPTSIMYK